jgi:hypothetical protein
VPGDTGLWLVFAKATSKTDTKAIGKTLGYGSTVVRFGDDETLLANLGARKGEVSPINIMNDTALRVNVAFDTALREEVGSGNVVVHPLTNEASIVIPMDALRKFVFSTGHTIIDANPCA